MDNGAEIIHASAKMRDAIEELGKIVRQLSYVSISLGISRCSAEAKIVDNVMTECLNAIALIGAQLEQAHRDMVTGKNLTAGIHRD